MESCWSCTARTGNGWYKYRYTLLPAFVACTTSSILPSVQISNNSNLWDYEYMRSSTVTLNSNLSRQWLVALVTGGLSSLWAFNTSASSASRNNSFSTAFSIRKKEKTINFYLLNHSNRCVMWKTFSQRIYSLFLSKELICQITTLEKVFDFFPFSVA